MFPAIRVSPAIARTRKFSLALLALPLAILLSVGAQGQELSAEDRLLREFLDGLSTFSAGFQQVLYSEFGEDLEHSRGTVAISRPGKFNWSYVEPYRQSIVSDGATLWIHDEDLEQVSVRDASHSLGDSPAAILDGSGDVGAHYVILNTGEQDGIGWIELTPRDADADYNTIRLGFMDGALSAMVLFDNLGQKSVITFLDVQRNPVLDESMFQFVPPPGVDVIDNRSDRGPD